MKIFCISDNHAGASAPAVTIKPDSALLTGGRPLFVPDHLAPVSMEGSVVVRICRLGKTVPVRFAHRYYDAATVGVDFTAAALLADLSRQGLPWSMAKCFDGAAAVGQWVDCAELPPPHEWQWRLAVNGETVHEGSTAALLRSVDEAVSWVSQSCTLKTGDLLYAGTPGRGLLPPQGTAREAHEGDLIEGWLCGREVLRFRCK